ncbi:MAG: restriction endonuclease subunit S [Anaerolinea sp.]|nr:restriction endonuclease subunit S [Anaerolinea sp.]
MSSNREKTTTRLESRTGGRPATNGVIPGQFALSVGKPNLPAPDGWQWIPLSDVARLESGHTPSRKHPEYWGGDIPWIGIKDAVDNHGRTIFDTYQHTNKLGIENSSARILPTNTVCLSRTASIGYVVAMGRPMATSQDFVNWVCSEELDFRFLRAVLLAESESYLRFASGTTHQTIYYPEVKAFHICLPPLSEQRAIAAILSGFDDKIDLNRRMNATLEATARALFQSWFVDFDPVRAKAEGRQPEGMDAATAALFPDSFEERELGMIPRGWAVSSVGYEFKITMGQSPPGDTYNETGEGMPFYQGRRDFGFRFPTQRVYCTQPTRLAEAGDTLVSVRAPVGDLNMTLDLCSIGRGVGAIRHCSGSRSFTYYAAHFLKLYFDYYNGEGTVFGAINSAGFRKIPFLHVPPELVQQFDCMVSPFDDAIENNERSIMSLAETRDALLPKLISGEVRVFDEGTSEEVLA